MAQQIDEKIMSNMRLTNLEKMMVNQEEIPDNIDALEMLLLQDGADIQHQDILNKISEIQKMKEEKLEDKIAIIRQDEEKRQKSVRVRPADYETRRNSQLAKRDYFSFTLNSLFTTWAIPIGILMLFVSEFYAVYESLSHLISWPIALVIAIGIVTWYFVVEWGLQQFLTIHKSATPAPQRKSQHRFSLEAILMFLDRRLNPFSKPFLDTTDAYAEFNEKNTTRWILLFTIAFSGALSRLFAIVSQLPTDVPSSETISLLVYQFDYIRYSFGFQELLFTIQQFLITIALLFATHVALGMQAKIYAMAVGKVELDFLDSDGPSKDFLEKIERVRREMELELEKEVIVLYKRLVYNRWQRKEKKILDEIAKLETLKAPLEKSAQEKPSQETLETNSNREEALGKAFISHGAIAAIDANGNN